MKREVRIFFTAVMYFTRLPVPTWVDHSAGFLNHSTRYFPLVGILVGLITATSFVLFNFLFNPVIAVLLSTTVSALITGAFHEDGLADFFDGFGGGWTKEKILEIMKDSRIGTFGFMGLFLVIVLKVFALQAFDPYDVPVLLISGHALSRFIAVTVIYTHTYVREDETAKAKPLASKISAKGLIMASLFGLVPLVLFLNPFVLLALLPVFMARYLLIRLFVRWIGGYTGDCLGAVQQISELIFYLSIFLIFKFIPWK